MRLLEDIRGEMACDENVSLVAVVIASDGRRLSFVICSDSESGNHARSGSDSVHMNSIRRPFPRFLVTVGAVGAMLEWRVVDCSGQNRARICNWMPRLAFETQSR